MPERRIRVVWTQAASDDLGAIVTYIAQDSPTNARRFLAKLKKKADSLKTAAERGRLVPELSRSGVLAFRELIVKPYRIMYRINGNGVTVLAVFDGRRDLEEVLLERLVRHRI